MKAAGQDEGAAAAGLTAALLLLSISLIPAAPDDLDADVEPDVPAICTDIFPRELFLADPSSSKQCPDTSSKMRAGRLEVAVTLQWDSSTDDKDTIVDIELYSIHKQNGTYIVHSMALMKDVDNTGHVQLPRWMNSALLSLKGDDLLFRIVESSQLDRDRVSKRDLRSFVMIFDRCPTLVKVLRSEPRMEYGKEQFSFKVNIKPPTLEEEPPTEESLQLSVGGSKDSITLQVNSGGETVSVKVGATEKSVSLKVDSNIKLRKPKLERGVSLSDEFEDLEKYIKGDTETVVEIEKNASMVYKAMVKLRSAYLIARHRFKQWRDYAKSRTHQYMEDSCHSWYEAELKEPLIYDGLPSPPCDLAEAISCPLFAPDTACNNGRGYCHFFHKGAYHCIRSVNASILGAGEQACYDINGRLLEYENGGGTFDKAHPEGYINIDFSTFPPKVNVFKLWRVHHFIEDVWPFLVCCKFTNHCDWYGRVRPTRLSCKHYAIDPDDSRLRHENFRDMTRRARLIHNGH